MVYQNYGPICLFANYDFFSLWLRMGTSLSRLWIFYTCILHICIHSCMNVTAYEWILIFGIFHVPVCHQKDIYVCISLRQKIFWRKSKIRKNETQETFTSGKLPPHTRIHLDAGYSNDVQKFHTHSLTLECDERNFTVAVARCLLQ